MPLFHRDQTAVEECESLGSCRFGGPEHHYTSFEAADEALMRLHDSADQSPKAVATRLEFDGLGSPELTALLRRRFKWTKNELRLIVLLDECFKVADPMEDAVVIPLLRSMSSLRHHEMLLGPREKRLLKHLEILKDDWLEHRR